MAYRDLIGQVQGILLERHELTADPAFGVSVHTSSLTNRKLRDLAGDPTTTGQLLPTHRWVATPRASCSTGRV